MISGSKIIHNQLLKHKVRDVFLYSGGAIMPLVDCFYKGKINYYVNSNEHNGCNAAVGYAKSSNKTGVMIVTSGPGLTNCVTSMLDSTNDSTPLIVFSGQVPLNAIGTCAFQESPATEITKSITKWSYCVQHPNELKSVIDEAFKVANNGKKGAVHIDLPKCILSSEVDINNQKPYILDMDTPQYKFKYHDDTINRINIIYKNEKTIIKIIDIINNSNKPILYVGQGCNHTSKELTNLINTYKIPVTTTMHAMGVYDETNTLSLQMCGMHGSYCANMALQNADCIIAIGARFDDRTTGLVSKYAPIAKLNNAIIQCNIEPSEIDKVVKTNYSVKLDSKYFINKLYPNLVKKDRSEWIKQIQSWKKEHPFEFYNAPNNQIKTQNVLVELNNQTSYRNDIKYTFGVGNHLMMGCQFIDWKIPNSIIASGSLGVMGCSIGYAIGSQIANPDKTIISIDGDGSFNMTLTDLKTIKEYNLPIKIALINDSSLMMVKIWEKLFFQERYTATNNPHNPNYVELAKSFGIKSLYCDNITNLKSCVKQFLKEDGPILCEFKVIGEECLPLVGPGKALDDMILFKEYKSNLDLSNEMAPN